MDKLKQFYNAYLADVVLLVRGAPLATGKIAAVAAVAGAVFGAKVF